MKMKKTNKKGISLIVLVITIIVMIILAGAVILTISNTNILDRAQEAVDKTNLSEVQTIASTLWAEAYLNGARTQEELEEKVLEGLKNVDTSDYDITVTISGVDVTLKVKVPDEWKENVTAIVDGVPIPKGFTASSATGENTKAGGLVIYEGTEEVNDANVEDARENRNQFVWIPVSTEDFVNEFKRDNFGMSYTLSNTLGTNYWEIVLDTTNMPSASQNTSYVSTDTLTEVQAMYTSVKKYGGFYIARYEAGGNAVDGTTKFGRGTLSVTMGKYPYNGVQWGTSMSNEVLDGGAVTLARSMYTSDTTVASYNTYGVVSTLTYGVQWDRALAWIKSIKGESFSLTSSSEYGNYSDTTLAKEDFNANAKYATATYNYSTTGYYDIGEWTDGTSFTTRSGNYIMTTGALSKANLCNIYDMAGNMFEWTMEGSSTNYRGYRGGFFSYTGFFYPVAHRIYDYPTNAYANYGFRPSLYIK